MTSSYFKCGQLRTFFFSSPKFIPNRKEVPYWRWAPSTSTHSDFEPFFSVTIHLIIKQIRKIVAFVRTDLIMNIEQPELVEYSTARENILGEGGCGRVYAGRFRGNNVAIKVIGKGRKMFSKN